MWPEESERPSSTAWKNSKKKNWKDEFRLYRRISQRIEGRDRNDFDGEKEHVLTANAGWGQGNLNRKSWG